MVVKDTSLEAYTYILPTLGQRQKAVFNIIRESNGLTNTEIAHRLGWSINTVTPRVFELRQMKLVELKEKRICTITGRKAMSWILKIGKVNKND